MTGLVLSDSAMAAEVCMVLGARARWARMRRLRPKRALGAMLRTVPQMLPTLEGGT